MLAMARAKVGQLISPRWARAESILAKKVSPSWGTPRILPSWPAAISSPVPALNPARTGAEMKSARNPSRSTPVASSRIPLRAARVDAATSARSGSPPAAEATAAAVRAARVEVVLTDRGREVPSRA